MKIDTSSGEFDYTYLSLGAGRQSTALYILATLQDPERPVPRAEAAVFADTGDEPAWVYDQLRRIESWGKEHGGPEIHVAQKGVLSEWVIDRQKQGKRFVTVPLFTAAEGGGSAGLLRRQCTREFKITPIQQKVREILGYKPRQHMKHRVRTLMGITVDEAIRMRQSPEKWVHNAYPLVDLGLTAADCSRIVEEAGFPTPKRSSCVYCPYHSDEFWADLKKNHPDEFARAVEFDYAIRNMTMAGRRQPGYVHRSLQPLDEVDFAHSEQNDLFGEDCHGVCGV